MSQARWADYPNFNKCEFDCKHTGANEMQHEFMIKLQQLRNMYGKPMLITSGFRSKFHPIEARKNSPGTHTTGLACDIGVSRSDAYEVLRLAMQLGFTGIGVSQKGGTRFIHLDVAQAPQFPRPNIWSY